MKRNISIYLIISSCCFLSFSQMYAQGCFPSDKLPSYITPLTDFGQRAEWSLDGKKIYFIDKPGGDVWMIDRKTRKASQISTPEYRPKGHGYYRVVCISNGDLLLGCGAERHKLYFQVLKKGFKSLPVNIEGEWLDEGPAVSRKSLKIAWTTPGQTQIYMGEILSTGAEARITNKKLLVDNKNVIVDGEKYEDIIESQNWRPDKEEELIFAQYRRGDGFSSDVFGINVNTGKIIDYSKAPQTYDEPEGIFPGGEYTLVESDKHRPSKGTSTIEIYKLKLDGTGKSYERLTYFTELKGYRASNPVVSDDANYIAFQGSHANSEAGAGCGIYLFDIVKYEKEKNKTMQDKK